MSNNVQPTVGGVPTDSRLWVILSFLLFGALKTGSDAMQQMAGISAKMTFVIQASIIFFVLIYGASGFREQWRSTHVK